LGIVNCFEKDYKTKYFFVKKTKGLINNLKDIKSQLFLLI